MRNFRFSARRVLSISSILTALPFASAAQSSSIPALSGDWGRNFLLFEPKPGEPAPVSYKGRLTPNPGYIGDDTNPNLTPRAAVALRNRAELARNGLAPDPHNQCHPEPTPFLFTVELGLRIIQQNDEVVLISLYDQKVRHIRMNVPHPAAVVPTWQGNSVGHYEGDTLVIDTIGQKVGPLSVIDIYGTPFSEKLHVIERYRLIDGAAARDAEQRNEARYLPPGVPSPLRNEYGRGSLDPDARQGLQVEITVDDPEIFNAQWRALITYQHVLGDWPEAICAENTYEYYANRDTNVPRAEKPDF